MDGPPSPHDNWNSQNPELPDSDIVTIDSDSDDSIIITNDNILYPPNIPTAPSWFHNLIESGAYISYINNEPAPEPLNLSLDAFDGPAHNTRSRSSVPAEEIGELSDFWHGTLRNLQNALAINSVSSESSSSTSATDMTEASASSPSSLEPAQNVRLLRSPPRSPSPEHRRNSQVREFDPNSPVLVSGQNSPVLVSGQNSPVPESGQSSPDRESGQNSPMQQSRQASPLREDGRISPPHEPIRLTLRRVTRRSSTSQESSSNSPLSEDQNIYVAEPPAKVRKLNSPKAADENDGETCPICLDSWGNTGEHRLVALRCGHLFGSQCIERWITDKNTKERCCPTCKMKASIKDIRYIYAKRLVAVDMREMTALQKQVETAQLEKHQIQMELKATKNEHRLMMLKLEQMREKLATSKGKQPSGRNWRFALDKNLDVWRDGGCRVLAYNCRTYEFYVSQKTTNNLFPGYGVRTVSCIDYKLGPFIPLHPKAIRDVAYSQPTDLLMSVGLDGAVKIVERGIPTTSIQCKMPLWSCAWDHDRPNNFYVGAVGGLIMSYDVRNTGAVMETLSTPGDMSPSVSLVSTEYGLISCQLNSAWLWRSTAVGMEPQQLPLRGPFSSLCYDEDSQRLAISCRPSQTSRARIVLYKVQRTESDEITYRLLEDMVGSSRSTVMSRTAFVKCSDSAWVASYSESESALLLYALSGGRVMSLPAAEPALDVCAGMVNGETILGALSDSRMRIYKSYLTASLY